jgi:predicted nucleic acid-binding protein
MIPGMNRLRREGKLARETYGRIKAELLADVAQVKVVGVEAGVLSQAIRILETAPLRGMDALHVATAVSAGCDLFVTADRRQAEGARNAGLVVECVEPSRESR